MRNSTHRKGAGVFRKVSRRARNRPPFVAGMIIITLTIFIGFSVVVAARTSVPEVMRAPGEIAPTDDFRQIEAPELGTVVTVNVREGDLVSAGQVLAILSSSDLSRQIQAVEAELGALRTLLANHNTILAALSVDSVGPPPVDASSELDYAISTLTVLKAQQDSDLEAIQRLNTELDSQRAARTRLMDRLTEKTARVAEAQSLFEKGLSTKPAVAASKDALSAIEDQIHALDLNISDNLKGIEALRAKRLQDRLALREKHVEEKFQVEQQQNLKDTELRTLRQRAAALEIVASADGHIHSVGFPNSGEIIERGETLFELLPTGEALVAVLRLPTRDIGHIETGMDVKMRLETFDARSTLPLEGRITSISPNRVFDRDLGEDFFRATVALDDSSDAFAAVEDRLGAGMVITAEVITRERSMLAYILKPIERSFSLAFSER